MLEYFLEDFFEQRLLEHFLEHFLEKDLETFGTMKPLCQMISLEQVLNDRCQKMSKRNASVRILFCRDLSSYKCLPKYFFAKEHLSKEWLILPV